MQRNMSLNTEGNIAKAAETALTTYAEVSRWNMATAFLWTKTGTESVPYQIRCKIGSDIVTLSINTEVVQLKAVTSLLNLSKSAGQDSVRKGHRKVHNVVLKIAGEAKK